MKVSPATRRLRDSALAAALLASALGSAFSADVSLKLSGGEEVPTVTTSATGTGTIVIKSDKSVTGAVKTLGVEGTMAHIHLAPPGENGPPIISLVKTAEYVWSVPEGSSLTDDQFKSFQAGDLYVNVHSAAHPGGEIRAQLKP
jgi:hypothetical protein